MSFHDSSIVIKKSTLRTVSLVLIALIIGVYAGSQFFVPAPAAATTTTTVLQKVSVSAGTNPALGSADAPVTIIEFSDFQCPYCRIAYLQALPQVKANYIDTGKVKFYYRNYPLSFHPSSMKSAEAAECANEQGKFWEMHDKMFDEQAKLGQGTVQYGVVDIKKWASEINLDSAAFNSCIDSDKYQSGIDKDVSDGNTAGVSGTPTFFIGTESDGYYVLGGAYPYSSFKTIIDAELTRLGKA